MNMTLAIVATGVAATGAAAALAAVAPTDWSGIAQAIGSLGTLIIAIGTVITTVMQARQKRDIEETRRNIEATKELAAKAATAVDGGMTKLVAAKEEAAAASAKLDEQARVRAEQGIADAAVLKEKERAAAAVAPVPSPSAEAITKKD